MARIHQLAVMSIDNTNLLELASILIEAVTILHDAVYPKPFHVHPAIRLICYNIAFAGDGDIPVHEYYRDVLEYCKANAEFDSPDEKEPEVKHGKPS